MPPPNPPILILGCGYLGTALARRLRDVPAGGAPPTIIGTTTTATRREALAAAGVQPLVLELAEADRLRQLLAEVRLVYLLIAPGGGRHGGYRAVYVDGVERFVTALPGSVAQVVYTSSTTVYGQDDGSWVDEESPTAPATDNGRALLAAEQRLLAGCAATGVAATVLRLTGLWAEDRGPQRLIGRYAGTERDDGEAYLNLVHRDDAVAALAALPAHRYHGLLNLNDDHPTTRRAYYDPLIAAAGLPPIRWRTGTGPAGKRVGNARIKALLDLRLAYPRHDLGPNRRS